MITCVTFRLQPHQQLAMIFEFIHRKGPMLFGKPLFKRFKHAMQSLNFFPLSSCLDPIKTSKIKQKRNRNV